MGKKILNFVKQYNAILIIISVFSVLYLITGDLFVPFVFAMIFKRIGLVMKSIVQGLLYKRKEIHYVKKDKYVQYCDTCEKEVFTQRMGNVYIAFSFIVASLPISVLYYQLSPLYSGLVGLGCGLLALFGISSVRCTKCYSKTRKIKEKQNPIDSVNSMKEEVVANDK